MGYRRGHVIHGAVSSSGSSSVSMWMLPGRAGPLSATGCTSDQEQVLLSRYASYGSHPLDLQMKHDEAAFEALGKLPSGAVAACRDVPNYKLSTLTSKVEATIEAPIHKVEAVFVSVGGSALDTINAVPWEKMACKVVVVDCTLVDDGCAGVGAVMKREGLLKEAQFKGVHVYKRVGA